jgi:alkylation response protein AidB-like acyl-CoA dehydrogenase
VLVTTDQLLALLVTMVSVLLFLALIAGGGLSYFLIRRLRGRPRARRTSAPVAVPPAAPATPPHASAGRSHTADEPVPKGDVVRDDPRIIALGLEAPLSIAAVFRNLDKIKPLLRQEVPESDRIGRTTPLAGGALRATGVYLWTFPANRGGLDAPYADRLEAVSQVARIDAGMAWVVHWLSSHSELAGRLDEESFTQLYPSLDLPTVFSATPPARAIETGTDTYRIEQARWRLGSGGYHADRWLAGANVFDAAGEPVIDKATGVHKAIGVWVPSDKLRQIDDWNPLGLRSSGSASYELTGPVEVPRGWSFEITGDTGAHFFPFMGVMVGAAQHLVDLTLQLVRSKRQAGVNTGSHDVTALADAMSSLDMLALGLRGYAQYIDRVRTERAGVFTSEEAAWIHTVGMPVRETLMRVRDITSDIYGTGYVPADSEFGRVLRDIQVGLAHAWFRRSDALDLRTRHMSVVLDSPRFAPIWDAGWPVQLPTGVPSPS